MTMSSDSPGVPGTNVEDGGTGPDDLDMVMAILSDHCRRYVLYCLRTSERPFGVEELAGRIVDWDGETTDGQKRRILTELRHKHLPKMEAFGVVEREGDEIRFDGSDMVIEPYLTLAAELEPTVSF